MKMPSEATRGYIYRVLVAVGAVLLAKGVITEGDLQVYDALAVAALGLASAKTSIKRKPTE